MKNKILIIALIIIVIVGITWNLIRGKNGEKNKNEQYYFSNSNYGNI